MKMMVEFDCDADIIDVPQCVIDSRELMRRRFLKWLYNKSIKHKYWVQVNDGGHKSYALCYRSDAFVEWLNKKVLRNDSENAVIVEQHVEIESNLGKYPTIQF